jgi:hypothetical protein
VYVMPEKGRLGCYMASGFRRLQVAIKVLNLPSWEGSNVGFP